MSFISIIPQMQALNQILSEFVSMINTGEVIGYEYEHMGLGDDIYNVSRHPDYGMLVAVHGLDVWKEKMACQ